MAKPNLFNAIQMTKPGKNRFDLSHDFKFSFNMGQLVPTCAIECVPGDSFVLSNEGLLRFAPLVAPTMHRFNQSQHYFFVPYRLLWKNWEKYITNTALESTGELPSFPFINISGVNYADKLPDYFGIPDPDGGSHTVSALPFAAYQMIYDEYYRDQNLITPNFEILDDGNQTSNTYLTVLRYRAWAHDYFTSALPFAQKGAAVDLPLGTVTLKENWEDEPENPKFVASGGGATGTGTISGSASGGGSIQSAGTGVSTVAYDPAGSLEVGATTINDLRRAMRLQEWLEKNARGGTRYIESMLVHFAVRSSDARLNRPEYITGNFTPVRISEVLNTTGTADAPQGEMAGHAVSVTGGKYGKYFCEEHGYIIGITSVLPEPAYQQGIPKHFLKINTPLEMFWPSFAHIGEQEVLNAEIYAEGNPDDRETFGYTPRYAEYKFLPNRVAGEFKTTLNYWHAGRIFASRPLLNANFVTADPTHRIFAVADPDIDKLYCHMYHKIKAVRPMPKFGTPQF